MRWIVIGYLTNPVQAEILRGLLEAQGIPARLEQEGAARALGLYIGFGEIALLVPETYVDQAQEVLDRWEQGEWEDGLPPWLPDEPNGDIGPN